MSTAPVTIRDVAKAAQVSVATVSRVFNRPNLVTAALRARVQDAADRLGYLADGAARALASRRSRAIGAIVPTLDNPVFAACIDALQQRLDEHGFALLIASAGYDAARETREVRVLLERGVDGLMLVGADHPSAVWALIERRRPAVPVVVTWSGEASRSTVACIGFDNRAAARRLVDHLLQLGHRRIAMIAGPTTGNDRAMARVAGVREALSAVGIALAPPYLTERPYTVPDGHAAALVLLSLPEPPTAIVCGNDHLALGALAGVRSLGLSVPHDVSVCGFDDLDFAAYASPPLTTVRVPAAEMGRRAADCLAAAAGRTEPPATALLEAPVMLRGSTGPPPGHRATARAPAATVTRPPRRRGTLRRAGGGPTEGPSAPR
ncbi:LacI family DNA-binding transcriptional regulator [Elioraea sp. Yellowstone]|jgi:LacI family transcriptional regulator|uniref:LacI family DNA-binding transcriptional regulator n=1 Tax=Elioraea sp. Yellowstone TaxID=2592070 RepID=UPI00114E3AAF|nr:LacI family DNA-binding transcriptional regulator [Elioraea sp. Yellowstone]TQF77410.1 LacI family DNA-binding transcriptional regulator [Elioraea sp. Yellowstone]